MEEGVLLRTLYSYAIALPERGRVGVVVTRQINWTNQKTNRMTSPDSRLADPRTPGSAQSPRTPWRLLALLTAMSGVSSLSLNILVPAIPGLVVKFATDPASVQLTVSLYL